MNDLLDWVEKAAVENFRIQHQTADILAKEAATTLTVLLAGLGAGTAYAIKAVSGEVSGPIAYGAVAFTIYLLALSMLLVLKCLMIQPIPSIFNEPKNLLNDLYSFSEIRKFELENMQDGIEAAGARNGRVARSLNRIRLAAVVSPTWFLMAFVFHYWESAWTAILSVAS
jgi:hypothetical protein